ncbi:hypothetical protein AB0O31_04085 [Kitasatospora cineracea]|jgi:hypothetical protein|uniref:Uncharacterized protein n=1 Tax=Kitasatospora cineracea TaxID=88074 RepID=A0A3N4RSJ9_9ACTN|nr:MULTISPECIES: hypothetical protein [Kitasatospora]MDR3035884.1 hypothetical protein [Kitasatospora sp.]WNW38836.1 hypothetical protein RKE32_15430 [Streptomyces sp. Li-HN-5-13]ROR43343.1 hypothetical protein EDD39_1490 [Kitasatospora cineracea]RPE33715.1 hypothetical protein EDD38_2011 [Kitasatospora cineracea]WAL72785.1 hypothetical protein OU787_15480 [Kitasatospora sp. YST-16]
MNATQSRHRWCVEIPHANEIRSGRHLFIVDAAAEEDARREAIERAESAEARRHRRDADLDLAQVTVVHLGLLRTH